MTQLALAKDSQREGATKGSGYLPTDAKDSNIIQLPLWGSDRRGVPNEFIRSSLFTVTNRNKPREVYKNKEIYVLGDGEITYSGEELRQDDEDVWMQIIHLIKEQPGDTPPEYIEFMPFSMTRALGWPKSSYYRNKLRSSLERMAVTGLTVKSRRLGKGLNLSLIRKFQWENSVGTGDSLKKWRVWIEPEVVVLFRGVEYTKISWEQRQSLSELGKWLHGYYSSHRKPYPIKVATLHHACGSKAKHIKHFKAKLREALAQLVKVGFLADFHIDARELVTVKRSASKLTEELI